MTDERPVLAIGDASEAVNGFVAGLQAAVDASDADLFNQAFAEDVLWGSPFGAVVAGYDDIHAIHLGMFAGGATAAGGGSHYEVEHARRLADDVAIAYLRRSSQAERGAQQPGRADTFDELALVVLVHRADRWWLAAGLHTPDRRREMYG